MAEKELCDAMTRLEKELYVLIEDLGTTRRINVIIPIIELPYDVLVHLGIVEMGYKLVDPDYAMISVVLGERELFGTWSRTFSSDRYSPKGMTYVDDKTTMGYSLPRSRRIPADGKYRVDVTFHSHSKNIVVDGCGHMYVNGFVVVKQVKSRKWVTIMETILGLEHERIIEKTETGGKLIVTIPKVTLY
jgi:hypothetical protein